MSIQCDIVLVDSGVNSQHKVFENHDLQGQAIVLDEDGNYTLGDDFEDQMGHGTAVYHVLNQNKVNANIYVLKLFDYDLHSDIDLDCMLYALNYIYNEIDCKILHLSLGITYCEDLTKLRVIFDQFAAKGVIVVSAFDNLGAISYPAAFDNVVGVDICPEAMQIREYQYIHNSPVNIRCFAKELKLPFLNNEYKNVIGSSFMAPFITNILINNYDQIGKEQKRALEILRENAAKEVFLEENPEPHKPFKINQAVVFPFNKEVHSIMAFNNLCDFEIKGIYDTRYLGNVGKKVSEILKYSKAEDFVIQDIDKLDWTDDFDTFILGHVRELSSILKRDLAADVIKKCITHNKKLYCFDDISEYLEDHDLTKLEYYYPEVAKGFSGNSLLGKLRCIGKPVLAVMGTSSRQGKFTLQLLLRELFLEQGVKVGQLGTEPTSLLYGFDEVYPVGYDATVQLSGYNSISYINTLMGRIEDKNVDLIMAGSQSQTVHYTTGNLRSYSLQNVEFLIGVEPDAVILCINANDEMEYIRRTINFIENYQSSKVIALVMYPVKKDFKWTVMGSKLDYEDPQEMGIIARGLRDEFNIPCYLLGEEAHMEHLVWHCINFFSELDE